MESLLARISALENEVKSYQKEQYDNVLRKYIKLNVKQNEKEEFRCKLDYDSYYFLITFTFQPTLINHYVDPEEEMEFQERRLLRCLEHFHNRQYFFCIEKHKTGVQHSHLLVKTEHSHTLQPLLLKCKINVTNSVALHPAINYKPIHKTKLDLDRSYDYIFDDKPDHPIYKK